MAATVIMPSAHEIMSEFNLTAQLNPSAPEFQMPIVFNPEAPTFTPLSDIKLRPEAADFIPLMGGWIELPALPSTDEATLKHKRQVVRQMPPASEEEWETRISKREKEVATIKALQSYRLYVEVFPRGEFRSEEDPSTPDPRDRSISKRMWKWNVEKWRLLLKSRCVYSKSFALQTREYLLTKEKEGSPIAIGGCEELVPGELKMMKSSRLHAMSAEAAQAQAFAANSRLAKMGGGKFQ